MDKAMYLEEPEAYNEVSDWKSEVSKLQMCVIVFRSRCLIAVCWVLTVELGPKETQSEI